MDPRQHSAAPLLAQETTPAPVRSLTPLSLEGRYEGFTIGDLAAVRNLLRGGSVIDWHRLYFNDRTEVDRFLRVQEFEPQNPDDLGRLDDLRDQAVEYLERHLELRVPDEVAEGVPARDLFLLASQKG
jgi:uncharacterized protein (TIGR04552 family)